MPLPCQGLQMNTLPDWKLLILTLMSIAPLCSHLKHPEKHLIIEELQMYRNITVNIKQQLCLKANMDLHCYQLNI